MGTIKKTTGKVTAKKASPPKVGALLKKARLEQKKKISHAVKALHISENYLKALEEGDVKELPKETSYTLGFMRGYAQFLGLDPEEILTLYRTQNNLPPKEKAEKPKTTSSLTSKETLHPAKDPSPILLWGSLLGAGLILMGAYFQKSISMKVFLALFGL